MSRLILFNKPYAVLSQFTDSENRQTLADFIPLKDVYAAGRLDRDSEGLLLLTDDGVLQQQISHPRHRKWKTYLAQIEGIPNEQALQQLRNGVRLKDGMTKPARIKPITEPILWQRDPPVRFRKKVPTSWLEIQIHEGRNRQVRRMTSAVGYPTLRLVRIAVGDWSIGTLQPGEWREIEV